MYRRLRWLAPLALFAAVALSGCGGSQFVLVELLRGTSIGAGQTFTAFSVTLDVLGETSSVEVTGEGGGNITLPTSFSAELPDRLVGQVLVNVAGLDEMFNVTATGIAAAKLTGSETTVIVTLEAGGGPICGNNSVEAGEQCDDGNTTSGDGCSATCQVEIPLGCGDGVVDAGEDCDDSGQSATCDLDCTLAECGDSTLNSTAGEQCDDGNSMSGDGCDDTCQLEMMMGVCGDGTVDPGEACDDGNTTPGDGCDGACQLEIAALCGGDGGGLSCGDVVTDNTSVSGINDFDTYACVPFMNVGPEITYVFTPTLDDTLQIDLTGLTADLDLFVLQDTGAGCDPGSCGAGMFSGLSGPSDEQVLIPVFAGNVYYLVVESFDAGGGPFTLSLGCASDATCGDGVIEAGETCDDGNTTPGDGCDASCQIEPCSLLTNGDLLVNTSTTMPAGVYDFGLLHVMPGATLTFDGPAPVEIWAENVIIEGTLDVSGSDGTDSGPTLPPNGGDAGPAGGGGGGGGSGSCNMPGTVWPDGMGGSPNGSPGIPAGDGGSGGLAFAVPASVPFATGGAFGPGSGGGGGGSASPGLNGDSGPPGMGGAPYSDPPMSLFTGGGGGGGGGADGGGGGGGGGALRIVSRTLFVTPGGTINATGGDGGVKGTMDFCTSGGGGGGAGGMVWLEASTLDIAGSVFAFGGLGGGPDMFTNQAGGAGSAGRLQLSSPNLLNTGMSGPLPFTRPDPPACR